MNFKQFLKKALEGIRFILREEQSMIKSLNNRHFLIFVINISIAYFIGFLIGMW